MDKRSISLALPAALLLGLLLSLMAARGASTVQAQPPLPDVHSAQALGLVVTATVGIDPDGCATTRQIRVAPGTRVYFCYRVTNTGSVTLTAHTLVQTVQDNEPEIIWDRQPDFDLPPGDTINTVDAGLELFARADQSLEAEVEWSARGVTSTEITSATAQTSVFVVRTGVAITKAAGVAGAPCTPGTEAIVPEEGSAGFCIVVENTGDTPLVQHELTDPLLELDVSFAYTLAPAELLTVTHDSLADLGVDGSLVRREITRALVNKVYYTATSPSGSAATGPASASDSATTTVSLAKPAVIFTATVGTDPATCAREKFLNLSSPNTEFYYCAILHNTGNVNITEHALSQPARNEYTQFTRVLAPGEIFSVTNEALEGLGEARALGPMTVRDLPNSQFSNSFTYTGTVSLATGVEDETRTYTRTSFSSASAGVASTPTPLPTATNTPRSSSSQPTSTPRPQSTATWTPVSPLPTPVQQSPTWTPTATRSFQISLLETPTAPALSPLVAAADVAATEAAAATLAALDATATAAMAAPTAPPTDMPTPTVLPPATSTLTPTDWAAAGAVDIGGMPTQRPVELPPPPPTPDALLFAAQTVDAMAMTAVWIWFMVGLLAFFVVAGVLVGLSFRQNERRRFDLVDAGLVEEYEFLMPPPAETRADNADGADADADEQWPDTLP